MVTSAPANRGNKGRPASEGGSLTAGVHVVAESDCVVLPLTPPNSESEQLAREAEAAEESTQSEENISETPASLPRPAIRPTAIPA
jgi:hypothetical protein